MNDLDAALGELPEDWPVEREHGGVYFDLYEGLRLGLVEAETESDYDFDHVALFSPLPEEAARSTSAYGFARAGAGAEALRAWRSPARRSSSGRGDRRRRAGRCSTTWRCSSTPPTTTSRRRTRTGIKVERVVDAPNTYAAFMAGPDGVRIEYVEHKPTFALK